MRERRLIDESTVRRVSELPPVVNQPIETTPNRAMVVPPAEPTSVGDTEVDQTIPSAAGSRGDDADLNRALVTNEARDNTQLAAKPVGNSQATGALTKAPSPRTQTADSRLRAERPETAPQRPPVTMADAAQSSTVAGQSRDKYALEEVVLGAPAAADKKSDAASKQQSVAPMTAKVFAPEQEHMPAPPRADQREEYAEYTANRITQVSEAPISTFSIDVDTASYSLIRNQLNNGYLPKPQAVRAEELINYFDYDYPMPQSRKQPFQPTISVLPSPWNEQRKLIHIGIRGYDIAPNKRPDSNLVFLLDVSGSMNSANKLPLVKQSVALLLDTLKPSDTVSIVVYAGAAGTVLEPTQVKDKAKVMQALNRLSAGGSTAGGAGIQLAYQLAEQNFDSEAVNRIILATDGDFNVGMQSNEDLKSLVERKRASGVYLSVLGFGRNNYQDDMMQTLAQNGNGVAAYIDTLSEAKKVLVDEATSTLFPIAKDVKLQVEFNPDTVRDYRLVGYETRHLNREDFNNDKVDAGDIGAGHTVTAIYEITPATADTASVDQPRYAKNDVRSTTGKNANEYGYLKIRYKLPSESKSRLIESAIPIDNSDIKRSVAAEAQFSIAVAGFAQLLANSPHTGALDYDAVINSAQQSKGADEFGYRAEFINLVRMAKIARP
ncbi:MAG: DUF3520 domain-containing protein [Gammaproteobacteria bacterium]|nr:DUF3520 domain-containing protein [Gammaproteobacteria bacterium]